MARKQFVSSKKNAPSRGAVSSKEAALHGRNHAALNGNDSDPAASAQSSDEEEDQLSPSSPASSNASSMFSSEEEADAGEEGRGEAMAVEVLPSSVGRGKQLRFPVVSRGKESRIDHHQDDADHQSDSDDESLLSIASNEEEEDENDSNRPSQSSPDRPSEPIASPYPIKGTRARKRHRPDSGYFKRMSTYVRDCLLTVREGTTADASPLFRDDAHREFRRKLDDGQVDRVVWKEPEPTEEAETAEDVKKSTKKSKSKEEKSSSSKRERESSSSRSRDADRKKDSRRSTSDKASESGGRSSSKPPKDTEEPRSSQKQPASSSSSSSSSFRDRERERDREKDRERDRQKETRDAKTNGTESSKTATPAKDQVCSKCKSKLSDDKNDPINQKDAKPTAKQPETERVGSFTISPSGGKDVTKLRADAQKLNEAARALKHEGNRKGSAEPGTAGQIAQGKCYLRSSAKFFQHALKLADIKAAYKELGDHQHARTYGDYSVTTLAQTSSLIESTIRTFQSAGNTKLVAIGYKMASLVHLTIYRLQHLKLFSLYSDLFTPGRSPDSRQNGTTPPIAIGSNDSSKEAAIRTHLLKEMEHTLRGFEMWRRYESCKVSVLPRITNPATADLQLLFDDLDGELERA